MYLTSQHSHLGWEILHWIAVLIIAAALTLVLAT